MSGTKKKNNFSVLVLIIKIEIISIVSVLYVWVCLCFPHFLSLGEKIYGFFITAELILIKVWKILQFYMLEVGYKMTSLIETLRIFQP